MELIPAELPSTAAGRTEPDQGHGGVFRHLTDASSPSPHPFGVPRSLKVGFPAFTVRFPTDWVWTQDVCGCDGTILEMVKGNAKALYGQERQDLDSAKCAVKLAGMFVWSAIADPKFTPYLFH